MCQSSVVTLCSNSWSFSTASDPSSPTRSENIHTFGLSSHLIIGKVLIKTTEVDLLVCLQTSFVQPLIIVANKCDVKKISELSEENQVGGASF